MDKHTPEQRHRNMSAIKGKNTKPEILVRKMLHSMGFRFRLHSKELPGKPDIVLPKYKTAIFVHGCFWHRHPDCKYSTSPSTNVEFWVRKFAENTLRDEKKINELISLGWKVHVIWTCEIKDTPDFRHKLKLLLT